MKIYTKRVQSRRIYRIKFRHKRFPRFNYLSSKYFLILISAMILKLAPGENSHGDESLHQGHQVEAGTKLNLGKIILL